MKTVTRALINKHVLTIEVVCSPCNFSTCC